MVYQSSAIVKFLFQLLDELAILWVIMAGFAMWYPQSALPPGLKNAPDGRKKFSYLIIGFAFVSTFLGVLQVGSLCFSVCIYNSYVCSSRR